MEIKKVKDILTALPKDHYWLLKYLCTHLSLVAEHTGKHVVQFFLCIIINTHTVHVGSNKMTAVTLSIVFGPNIFRYTIICVHDDVCVLCV